MTSKTPSTKTKKTTKIKASSGKQLTPQELEELLAYSVEEGQTYNGNANLKKHGVAIQWTPAMIKEYMKCQNDPIYFARTYMKVVHPDKGFVPLDLYDYQEDIIRQFNANRNTAVVTSRQAGKTTTAVALITHYILFNEHKTVAVLANKGSAAIEVLSRIQLAYEALPKWLQQGVLVWNKGSIELENGCKIIAAATSSSNIRGKSISLLYLDEVAFIENYDDFFASVYPTISAGKETKMLMTSTPNGLNHFYKTIKGAKEGTNGFGWLEVKWNAVPGRDEKWKQDTLQALDFDLQKFAQEYECEFQGSSGTLISGEKLKNFVFERPIVEHGGLRQYVAPIKADSELGTEAHSYVIVADTSRGKGLDYSAFSVFNITKIPYQQVCVFKDNMIGPSDYARIIFNMAKTYNDAYVLVEINDIGQQVSEAIAYEYEYDNVIYTQTSSGGKGKQISGGFGGSSDCGIRTTKTVKAIGCATLKSLLEIDKLIVKDFDTISELSRFSKKGNSYEAEIGSHDDLVMGLVLFAWFTVQDFFAAVTDINTLNQLREIDDAEMEKDLLPFGFNDNAFSDYTSYNLPYSSFNQDPEW